MRTLTLIVALVVMFGATTFARGDTPTEKTWASAVDRSSGTWEWLDPDTGTRILRVTARWIQPRDRMVWVWEGPHSVGSAMISWDEQSGRPVANGTIRIGEQLQIIRMVLVDITSNTNTWDSRITGANGKVLEERTSIETFTGPNLMTQALTLKSKAELATLPARINCRRINAFVEQMPMAPKLVGNWKRLHKDRHGRNITTIVKTDWGSDRRSLIWTAEARLDNGELVNGFTILAGHNRQTKLITAYMTTITGDVGTGVMDVESDKRFSIRWQMTEPDGAPLELTVRQEIEGDTLTITWTGVVSDGSPVPMPPHDDKVFTRIK